MTDFNLRRLKLRPGEEHRAEVELELEPLSLAGQRYVPVPACVPADLRVTKASTGTVFQLGFRTRLHGPCFRCLVDAVLEVPIQAREYQANNPGESEELRTPYLDGDNLDLSAWARDAVALSLPDKILCEPDCAGLCPVCGRDLNVEPHQHEEAAGDPRWTVLQDLREKL